MRNFLNGSRFSLSTRWCVNPEWSFKICFQARKAWKGRENETQLFCRPLNARLFLTDTRTPLNAPRRPSTPLDTKLHARANKLLACCLGFYNFMLSGQHADACTRTRLTKQLLHLYLYPPRASGVWPLEDFFQGNLSTKPRTESCRIARWFFLC